MEPLSTIGVAGAGVMGSEVAQVFASGGHPVVLVDVDREALVRARAVVERNLRFGKLLGSRPAPTASGKALDLITFTDDYGLFRGVDFVVENVTEDWETKREVYEEIDPLCPAHCVFAVNTSVISIDRVAAVTARPDLVIGTHFMNPVSLKPVVEVVRGPRTSPDTIETTRQLLAGIGKECVVVNDSPGFVTNRILMLTVNEAVFTLQEEITSAENIDRLFKTCFGHAMGPLETADLIGLDTVLRSIELLHEQFGDSKYRPCPLLAEMVDAGLRGRKSGEGFFRYPVESHQS